MWLLACVAVASSLTGIACNNATPAATAYPTQYRGPQALGFSIGATLTEWTIQLTNPIFYGSSGFINAVNRGQISHELIVIKTDISSDKLPILGGQVEEEKAGVVIGRVSNLQPGETRQFYMNNIEPGRYVLIDNIPGHYEQGMHASFLIKSF